MENRYNIAYDFKKRLITNIRFKQGDIDSSVLEVSLLDNSIPVDITGETIEFRFLKPDNNVVYQDLNNGVNIIYGTTGIVECVLMSNTLASPGVVKCEIHRGKDGKELTTSTFNFTVENSIGADGILSSNYISTIEHELIKIVDVENIRITNETNRISNEDLRKGNEVYRINNEISRETEFDLIKDKLKIFDIRDAEVIDARLGETTLKVKLQKIDSKLSQIINSSVGGSYMYVNVQDFGANGYALGDDTEHSDPITVFDSF